MILSKNITEGPNTSQKKIYLRKTSCQLLHTTPQNPIKTIPQEDIKTHDSVIYCEVNGSLRPTKVINNPSQDQFGKKYTIKF